MLPVDMARTRGRADVVAFIEGCTYIERVFENEWERFFCFISSLPFRRICCKAMAWRGGIQRQILPIIT